MCELADDDSTSEFGGRQSSGSRGTPSGQQWQAVPRENSLPAARYGGSSLLFYILCYSIDRRKIHDLFQSLLFKMITDLWLYGCALRFCAYWISLMSFTCFWRVLLSWRMIFLSRMLVFISTTAAMRLPNTACLCI